MPNHSETTTQISRLSVPEETTLPEDIRELYADDAREARICTERLPRPQPAAAAAAWLHGTVRLDHADELGLSKAEREMIAVAVSAQNHCFYCLVSHGAVLRIRSGNPILADTIAANYRAADLTPRQRAMLDLAVKITNASDTVGDEDIEGLRAHGFSDADIMDIVQTAAFFNYSNRVASALALRPNREYHGMARKEKEIRD